MAAFAVPPDLQGCVWVPGTEEVRAYPYLNGQGVSFIPELLKKWAVTGKRGFKSAFLCWESTVPIPFVWSMFTNAL